MKMNKREVKEILKNNLNKYCVYNFFAKEKLDEDILEKYIGYFDEFYQFEKIVSEEVPEDWWIEFIEDKFGIEELWSLISKYQKLPESFIEKHIDKLNFSDISKFQKLSDDFISKYSDYLEWHLISCYQNLSESLIDRYSDKVDWYLISGNQKLSESFIEKHSKEVRWHLISKYQKLSEEFKKKHHKFIEME